MDNTLVLRVFALSGHAQRVRLPLAFLDLPYRRVAVNVVAGEHKTPEFLAKNPMGHSARAPEGGVSLEPYPPVRQWLPCIEALPRCESMPVANKANTP